MVVLLRVLRFHETARIFIFNLFRLSSRAGQTVAEEFLDRKVHPINICRAYTKALEDSLDIMEVRRRRGGGGGSVGRYRIDPPY